MPPTVRALSAAVLSLAIVGLPGCGPRFGEGRSGDMVESKGGAETPAGRLVLFAAASTANALEEMSDRFGKEHGIVIDTNFAASSTLAQQIENGAGADVFVSANETWADYLEERGLVAGRRDILGNRLVVITPAGSSTGVKKPEDLLDEKIRHVALADPDAVPAGIYAKQALVALGLWPQLEPKVVAGADVRQALSFVETGAAEAGIVYATDAAISPSARVAVRLGPELTEPICYSTVLLKAGEGDPAARSFFDYLTSPPAVRVFRRYGFLILPDDVPPVE